MRQVAPAPTTDRKEPPVLLPGPAGGQQAVQAVDEGEEHSRQAHVEAAGLPAKQRPHPMSSYRVHAWAA